jgi:hypothetical protein
MLYGLLKRLHSTRPLEDATRMRMDFRWFLEARTVDHTTFACFRNRFGSQIEGLFKKLNRRAAELKKATLEEVLIDGTRLRANSDRHGARTAQSLEKKLAALEEEIRQGLLSLGEDDDEDSRPTSSQELEERLHRLEAEREKLTNALAVAHERDQKKREKDGKNAHPVRVPVTDPDAHILPNKEGGYAPNYTPVVGVDPNSGLIVGATVIPANAQADSVEPILDQVRDLKGDNPKAVAFDGGFASGPNLDGLGKAGIDVYAPAGPSPQENPALRSDPTAPVPTAQQAHLPRRGGKLDRAAFLYDEQNDMYYCPMGRPMPRGKTVTRKASENSASEYRGLDCSGCPLAADCLSKKAKTRSVTRDQYEPSREALQARMHTPQGRALYAKRAPFAEGTFAVIKSHLGIRRFMRRGLAKVTADWFLACTAYNILKLLKSDSSALSSSTPPRKKNRPAASAWFFAFFRFSCCLAAPNRLRFVFPLPALTA